MNTDFIITGIRRVILVGKEEYPEPVTSFYNGLRCHELIFHFSGQSSIHFNGNVLSMAENTIRYLPKGEVREYTVYREAPGDCIDVFFDADVPLSEEAFVLKCTKPDKVGKLFKKLFSVWVAKEDGYYFECISLLYKIFAELNRENYIPEKQYLTIKPAVEYLNNHFLQQELSTEALAELCGISYSYLKRLFLKRFGMPPAKYAIQLKVNYACDLLQSGLYTVSRVAEVCGYGSIHYFSRQFKEHMGISPSKFIEKYKSSK